MLKFKIDNTPWVFCHWEMPKLVFTMDDARNRRQVEIWLTARKYIVAKVGRTDHEWVFAMFPADFTHKEMANRWFGSSRSMLSSAGFTEDECGELAVHGVANSIKPALHSDYNRDSKVLNHILDEILKQEKV